MPSTSVNYFHLLRRQVRRNFRKPLIAFNSKRLLRARYACSDLEQFGLDHDFKWIYNEVDQDWVKSDNQIKKVVLCSGQVYYDIHAKRLELDQRDVVVLRVEQLSPFPYSLLEEQIKRYPNAQIIWAQEEHQNQGCWNFVRPRINQVLMNVDKQNNVRYTSYVGRKSSASSATGSGKQHNNQLKQLLEQIFA